MVPRSSRTRHHAGGGGERSAAPSPDRALLRWPGMPCGHLGAGPRKVQSCSYPTGRPHRLGPLVGLALTGSLIPPRYGPADARVMKRAEAEVFTALDANA